MKLCIVSSTFPPQEPVGFCGIGDYSYQLVKALSESSWSIDVLTSTAYAGSPQPWPNVAVFPLVNGWRLNQLALIKQFWDDHPVDLVNIQYQPDLLGSRWSPFNIALWRLARMGNRPVLTTFHTLTNPSPLSPTRLTANSLIKQSDHIIITNQQHKSELLKNWPAAKKKYSQLPVGSNIYPTSKQQLNRSQIRDNVRQQLKIAADELLVANFGRLYPGKGIENLLEAISKGRERGNPIRLLILGHTPAGMESYEHLIAAKIRALGLESFVMRQYDLSDREVSEFLLAADLYAAPFSDGLSDRRTSAMIGFAHGLPVVSTKGTATPDHFVADENVLLVPAEDSYALALALERVCQDVTMRQTLSLAGRQQFKQYEWQAIARRMIEVVEKVIAENGRTGEHAAITVK